MITPITVDFLGSPLTVLRDDDRGDLVPLRPLVAGMKVDWSAQYRRVQRHPVLSRAVVIMATTGSPAGEKEGVCLPLDLIPGFLFGVAAERITDADAKARIVRFQTECFKVLARACLGRAPKPAEALPAPSPDRPEALAVRMVSEARKSFGTDASRALWFKVGLPVVAEMRPAPAAQGSLFTYTAERAGGQH